MRTLDRDTVVDALYDSGLDDEALYEDYSGRAMYGDKCLGIVHDEPGAVARFYLALAANGAEDEAMEMTRAERGDSMGLSAITYWPGWTVTEEVAA